ncbi:hypothetical protein QYF61_016236 [Mycteria americana]|uniref:Reverse transcriptase/retrotransposon-derived protein RNase H-like domain-containing protein n=1 Tax=Mycteria americana TaxID=33587 RepID=A0AAN7RQP0_MYCAM|nr:hypothetical protein QYF61_016236 [Mycteria americana]
MPQSRKELQQLMGALGYWRKHVPGFSIISRPLYSLLRKGKPWEWKLEHKEAVKTLTEELKTYQSLGPVQPRNPILAEWATEQRYSEWEKGLLSLVRAVKQVEKIHQGQPVQTRGPFNLLEAILKGTAPPEGVAQKPTVRKWYAYLTGVAENMQLTEGHTKLSKWQMPINTDPLALQQPFKPSPILDAPPLTEGTPTENIWFTDASAKRVNGKWQYKAVALHITTGKQVVEEGEGSAQVGEIRAVVLAAQNGAKVIYVDSYAVWAGATQEQQGFICESNTIKAQDICLDTEQNVCHFEIYPDEAPETVLVYIGKGCVCMRTLCDFIIVDNITVDTSYHSNICVRNFTIH